MLNKMLWNNGQNKKVLQFGEGHEGVATPFGAVVLKMNKVIDQMVLIFLDQKMRIVEIDR